MANLKKYQLTPRGVVTPVINITKNVKTGDPRMRFVTSQLNDAHAELLLSRKDKQGEKFVKPIPQSSNTTPSSSNTSSKTSSSPLKK